MKLVKLFIKHTQTALEHTHSTKLSPHYIETTQNLTTGKSDVVILSRGKIHEFTLTQKITQSTEPNLTYQSINDLNNLV